jgi:hypothetical protein
MKKTFLFALFVLFTVVVKAQYVGLNDKEITNLRTLIGSDADVKKQYNGFIKLADEAVNENPNPIDTIRSEGLLAGNPKKIATATALRDMHKMYALAITYKVENEKSYLQNLRSYLIAWAKVNISKGDPIDDTNLDEAIEAYDMVKDKLKPEDRALISGWLTQVGQAEINTFKPAKQTGYNNWHSHRLKEVGEIGFAIGNADFQKFAIEGLKKQIEVNLYADGSGVDFKLRDALHYHAYDLEPLLQLAIVLKRATGVDYYSMASPSGSSIKKSTEWFVPYVTGEKTHGEFVNSTVKFDQARAKNGEKDYVPGTLFNPKNGIKTLTLAAYFDQQYNATVKTVKAAGNSYSEWQLVVNKAELN